MSTKLVYKDCAMESGKWRERTRLFRHLVGETRMVTVDGKRQAITFEPHIKDTGMLGTLAREIWENEASPEELLRFGKLDPDPKKSLLKKIDLCREFLTLHIRPELLRDSWYIRRLCILHRWDAITKFLVSGHRPRKQRIAMTKQFREMFLKIQNAK